MICLITMTINKTFSLKPLKNNDNGIALYSSTHTGAMRELMLEDRTIGELLLAKEKPVLLFKILKLINTI